MQTIALAQVQAMLTETIAMSGRDARDPEAILALGMQETKPGRLARFKELTPILGAVERAVSQTSDGTIAIDETVWKQFENIYYRRVVKSLFS